MNKLIRFAYSLRTRRLVVSYRVFLFSTFMPFYLLVNKPLAVLYLVVNLLFPSIFVTAFRRLFPEKKGE